MFSEFLVSSVSFLCESSLCLLVTGFIAGLCALPMWVLSLHFFRREYYRLFKTSHFLFIGVFGAGMVHYDGFVHYLLAGFVLYLVHAVSRLGNWNW